MKKIALLSLVFVMLLSLFACGEKNNGTDITPSTSTDATESKAENEATESQDEATESETEPEVSTTQEEKLQQFEQGLTAKGIKFEKIDSEDWEDPSLSGFASWYGAEKCYSYQLGENYEYGYAYVFLFDKESEHYKQSFKENKISYIPEITGGYSSRDVVFCDDICIDYHTIGVDSDNQAVIRTIWDDIK